MLKRISDFFAGWKMSVLSGVFLILSLIFLLSGIAVPIDPAWVTVILAGYPLLYLAVTRLIYEKWVSSALLISIAMLASIAIGELFAAGEVAFIMAIGAILEDMTVLRAKKGLSALIALAPTEGHKLITKDGIVTEVKIPADQIQNGDMLRVFPGEIIPVDGVILTGNTAVNQAILTGESLPVDKEVGEEVFCGTLNHFGSIDIRATSVGQDSSLQKLIRLVQEAENKKAPIQRVADQWAVWLVPIALLIAVATFVITWLLGVETMSALNRAVTVLVVFCPCALALATPTAVMAAIGQATKRGVIIKSGEALEKMGRIDTIAFDKTGTLTLGQLQVSDIISFEASLSQPQLLTLTASAEAKSEHPLGQAITAHAQKNNMVLTESTRFEMSAGKGITAQIEDKTILCGSEAYLTEHQVAIENNIVKAIEALTLQGKALVLTAVNGRCVGLIALSDTLRPDAASIIQQLNSMGAQTVLLTGDNPKTAAYFAKQAKISQVYAGLLPQDKMEHITQLQKSGKNVCMIGDGVNDAPALKTANIGVAMGSAGSDIAIEAADIALMSDDISKVAYLTRLSRSALRTIKGNITASMCINFAAITLSVLGLLNPITGALVHNAGSVLVVLNAALLYDRKFD